MWTSIAYASEAGKSYDLWIAAGDLLFSWPLLSGSGLVVVWMLAKSFLKNRQAKQSPKQDENFHETLKALEEAENKDFDAALDAQSYKLSQKSKTDLSKILCLFCLVLFLGSCSMQTGTDTPQNQYATQQDLLLLSKKIVLKSTLEKRIELLTQKIQASLSFYLGFIDKQFCQQKRGNYHNQVCLLPAEQLEVVEVLEQIQQREIARGVPLWLPTVRMYETK